MKIFIEIPTWLGDAIMTTPAIENIIKTYPKAKITLLGSFVSTQALENFKNIEKIIVDDTKKQGNRYLNLYKLAKKIGKVDLAISFRRSFSSKFMMFFIDAKEKLSVVASKSHLSPQTQEFIDNLDTKNIEQVSKGSSLKLCMVATGEADIYPRLAPTMEWDTAAADAVVRTAGKMTYEYKIDEPLVYNKQDLLNPWFVVK